MNAGWLNDVNAELLIGGLLFTGPETEPILVDTSTPRWEAVEPEQLPH